MVAQVACIPFELRYAQQLGGDIKMIMKKTSLSVMVAACFVSTGAMAQEGKLLAPVVVTATRVE